MKLITRAEQINIYSKELVQIYDDIESSKSIELSQKQKDSIKLKLEQFSIYLETKRKRMEDTQKRFETESS